MGAIEKDLIGTISLAFQSSSITEPCIVTIPNADQSVFMSIAASAATMSSPICGLTTQTYTPKEYGDNISLAVHSTEPFCVSGVSKDEVIKTGDEKGSDMSDFNRAELQAQLKANKAEVDAVAFSMKKDMAEWRERMSLDLRDIKNIVSSQHESINHRFDLQSLRIETALQAHSTKVDAAVQVQEAKLEGKLSDVKLDIIKWALGLPALAFTTYKIYGAISGHPTP